MPDGEHQDWEAWQRKIYEGLRPIDPKALFWVGLLEIDFREAPGHRLEDFPVDELCQWVDAWLSELDPEGEQSEREWTGGGVRLRFRAKGRKQPQRGWTAMPSFNLLEQPMSDLHFVGGERRPLISLTLEEVQQLARGELRVVGQGASCQETFQMLVAQMAHFGHQAVADLQPTEITVYAGQLGLVDPPPELGSFERGWRGIHGIPPDE